MTEHTPAPQAGTALLTDAELFETYRLARERAEGDWEQYGRAIEAAVLAKLSAQPAKCTYPECACEGPRADGACGRAQPAPAASGEVLQRARNWLMEREGTARAIAAGKSDEDKAGWLQDAAEFRNALQELDRLAAVPAQRPERGWRPTQDIVMKADDPDSLAPQRLFTPADVLFTSPKPVAPQTEVTMGTMGDGRVFMTAKEPVDVVRLSDAPDAQPPHDQEGS